MHHNRTQPSMTIKGVLLVSGHTVGVSCLKQNTNPSGNFVFLWLVQYVFSIIIDTGRFLCDMLNGVVLIL